MTRLAPAAESWRGELNTQSQRVLDLGTAEDPPVAGRECLRDRRRRPEHVDHDPDRCRTRLGGSECDVNAHPTTLLRAWLKPSRKPATATPTGSPVSPARSVAGPSVRSA